MSRLRLVQDDELERPSEEAGAAETTSGTMQWFQSRMEGMLRRKGESALSFSQEDMLVLFEFVDDHSKRRLFVYFDQRDHVRIGLTLPKGTRKKSVFLLKQRSFNLEGDGSLTGVLMGDVPPDILENLSTVSHEVLYPTLCAGRSKDFETTNKEVTEVFHRFLSQAYLTVGQTQGKTLLPLPPRDAKWEEGTGERSVKDKERVHVLESSVVTWTQQIKNVLRREPPSFIQPGNRETGTAAEFVYWKGRCEDLSFIDEQLKSTRVQQVLRVLEMTKSTYEKPFQKLVAEVEIAREEAQDVHLFLGPLQHLLKSFEDVGLDQLKPMFKPAMHTISLIYAHSKSFCTPPRLQAILEKLGNDVIHTALRFVNGRTILDSDPSVVEDKLHTTIQLFGELKSTYLEYKEASMATERQWLLQDELVFNLPDQFVERCYDMIDLVQMASSFGQLQNVQVGGDIRMARSIDQINSEFHAALRLIESTGYDLLDIAAKKYNDDFFEFRRTVRDCERRLGSMISERMENVVTLGAAFNFLACFEVMLDRKIIMDCLYETEVHLLEQVRAELQSVNDAFVAGQDTPPPFYNMPIHSSRVFWCRSLIDRIKTPMDSAHRMLRNVFETPEAKEVVRQYEVLLEQISNFEKEEIGRFLNGIDTRLAEKLKQPLLVRDQGATKKIKLNFDPGVWSLLREARYFYLLQVDVPEAVEVVYSKAEIYQQHAGNIQLIVNSYNILLSSMADVELPLMLPKLELVDEALEEGLEHLNWRNHSIASFIKKTTSYIADATNLLAMLKSSVRSICEMLRGWGTTSLHGTRKNTVGAEEYHMAYKASVEARLNSFRDEAAQINSLIAQIHMALQVSRGDPAWRKYVEHVNDMIVSTLRTSIIESLESIRAMIDPATRKELSNALVEVRLELVAPEALFFPEISSNLSHSSLEDLVEYWITATLSIAKLLQRIDSGESNYYSEIANSPDVLELVSTIRDVATRAFEMAQSHRNTYLEYSHFWMSQPSEEFGAFLQKIRSMEGDDSNPLNQLGLFDKKIAELKGVEATIKAMHNRETIIWISVDAKPMKQALFTLLSKWTFAYTNHLLKELQEKTSEMSAFVSEANAGLKSFSDEDDDAVPLSVIMGVITEVRKNSSKTEEMFGPWLEAIDLLQRYGVDVPTEVVQAARAGPKIWNVLKKRMYQCRTMLEDTCNREQNRLRKESAEFIVRANAFCEWFRESMPFVMGAGPDPDSAYSMIDSQRHVNIFEPSDSRMCLSLKLSELRDLNQQEELYDIKPTVHEGLQRCSDDLVKLKHVWDLVCVVNQSFSRWNEIMWFGVKLDVLIKEMQELEQLVAKSHNQHSGWPVYESMKEKIVTSLEAVSLMSLLQSPVLRQRHWKQLLRVTGGSLMNETDIKLHDLFALSLPSHSRDVEELVTSAEKECEIEARLQAIEDKWSQLSLTFTHSDAHKWVLNPQGGMMSILHEALVELQSLSFNTNVAKNSSFSELVRSLQQQLSGAESLLSIWLLAQHKHATLHALFSSAVSRSQCGEHADAFEQVHSSWRHMMTAAAALPSLQDTCTQGDRHKQVKALLIKLEDSQAKLLAFLDDQRSAVPRFYMLSNEALLVLLSLEAHPNECMPYIRQLFPGIQELGIEFKNGGENQAFTSMRGRHGERVSLTTPVMCDGAVQKWVVEVEAGIQEALKSELSGMATTKGARHEMWLVTPALQLAATLVSIEHCAGIEECLLAGADKGRLSSYRGQLEQDAAMLARQVRMEDLPDVERNKLSAMITHTGMWRSIVEELCCASAGGGGVDQFDWRVNLRFYMQKDTHQSGGAGLVKATGLKCTIGMCNITKDYGYSYVGDDFAPLVRTSTSQAVQIALITAHEMASGGHIKGPSSSGKLEIVRCTANTIGLPCIVVQAHSSFSHRWLAATVSGVAHMGAWLLMRNFEKFPTSILSHLAQLYSAVLTFVKKERQGKKNAARARSSKQFDKNADASATADKVLLDGVQISVHTRTLLIASSVWEANAPLRAVPETLALLLRPATTHLFEPLPVITGWLFAKGFGASSAEIAAILVRFFKLCQHSLSPAAHYDWGLRHIKRVLAIAQPTLGDEVVRYSSADFNREMPEPSMEDALSVLGRACRLSISSRLLPEDEKTFRALIDGAFFSQKPSSPEPVDATPQQVPKLARQGSRAPGKNPLMVSSVVQKRPPLARHTSSFKMYMGQWVPDERADQDSGLRRGVQEEHTANMPSVVSEMGFQPFDTFVARANGLCESLASCQTAFVTGPVGCGKTSLIQVCARQPASARHGMSQAAVVRSISLRMMSVERLFGYIDVGGSMRWVDGVLSTIYRDMAAVGEGEDVPQQWLVLDGCLGGEWLSMVERTLHKDGELMLSSQERIRKTSKMRTIFESDTLTHAAPSLVSHGAITCMRDNDVGWSGFVQSWLSKSTESYSNSFLAKLLGNGDDDIIPCALAFLTLECSFVATVNQQALVETITTLLSATSSLRSGEVEITANPTDSSVFSTSESHSPNVLRTLCFALMWGFGAMLKPESRPKFSAWLRSIGEEYKAGMHGPWAGLPSTGLVWDYFPDHDESGVGCVWKPWSESVPAFRYIWSGSDEPDTIVVPTEGLASAQHVMRTLNKQGRPVLVMGGPGVGKTQVVRDMMAGLDLEVVTRCCVTLSGATDTEALQNALEVPLEGNSGKTQGNNTSGGNAKVCYFIDDLHLPRQDAYGEQAALELIRHVLDRGHWFDRDSCQERTIHKCTFIGAMSPSHVATASRARFIRHFSPIILHDPSPPELQHIYESLTSSLFRSLDADADLLRLAQPLVRCTIKQLTGLSSVLMPSHEKPHYLFSQHDIAKVFHGLFENSELCTSPLQATQLWLFLCKSTFMGRLVSQDDCNMCLRIIMNSIDSLNEHIDMESISKMHCNFICARDGLNQPAIRIVQPWQDPADIIKQRIDTSGPTVACTGGAPTEDDLNAWAALCGDVLTKVTTSLHHSGGHVHLAGPGGSGKYTVAKAAAVLCGLQVVELHVTEGEESLRQQLCSVFWDAGVGKVNQALLLPSHIPASSGVLGMISDVLAPSGYAQMIALFTAARQNDIYAAMRGDVRKQGMEDSRENCWVLFNIQAHKHLRVVCTSATNDIAHWGRTAMSYPLLITRMTVVWLGALPPEKTHAFGMPYLQSLLEKELQEERPELVSQVSRHLTLVHQAAADFLARPQPPDPTPPLASYPSVSFTWYAQTWTTIYTRMRDEVREKLRRAVIATDKLDAELTRLSDLEAAIEDQRQVVEQKKLVANRLLANVGQETALLNEQKVILEEDANAERSKAQIVREIEQDIRMHMDDMAPFQELAATSLERIETPILVDIRGLATPPESVLAVIRCIVVLLIPRGKQMPLPEALAWKEVRKCLNNTGFIAQLEKFDVKNTSLEAVDVAEGFIKTESFSAPEKDGAIQTPTIEGLKAWVEATVKLFHLQEQLKPMEQRLEEKRSEYDSAKAKYNDLQSRVRNLEVRLGDVMSSFQDATEEKNAAIMRLDDLTASCAIARKLAVCLAGGRANRLQQARERFKQKMECLLGDSLTAAAFVSFGGALGANCRESFIRYQVLADLRAQKVQVSSGPVLSLFASHYTAEDWKAMGLPDDQYCLESASIALNSTAWPLLVDPEGVGLRWLTALYQKEGTTLTVVPNQSPALLPKIRACVQNGTPIVITGPLAGIDPGIMLVASRRYYTHQRTVVVDVAGEVLEVHPKFRLFFSTGLGRVDFCLELSYIASVVSFTGSEESAWQKAMWCVVGHEAPSVRDALLDMHARRRQLLRDKEGLEDAMLKALSEEEGMVLSDGLAARLSEDLGAADTLEKELVDAEDDLAAAKEVMRLYEPVARRGAVLMQVATKLIQVSPICAFSTPTLLEAIEEGVERSAQTIDDSILKSLIVSRKKARASEGEGDGERQGERKGAGEGGEPKEAEEEATTKVREEERKKGLDIVRAGAIRCMRGVTERVAEVVGAAMETKDRNVFSAMVAIAVFLDAQPAEKRAEKQEVIDLYLTMPAAKAHAPKTGSTPSSPFPSWLPDSSHSAIIHFTKTKRGSPLKDVGSNMRDAKILFDTAEPELLPEEEWPKWGLDALERWVALCALRPDRAVRGAHMFASHVLAGKLPLEPPALTSLIQQGTAATRPLLIVLPHSSDLFDMQESLLQAVGGGFDRAIVDGNNDEHVSAAVDSAMQLGRTILVHSPELSVKWQRTYLDPLLDRLSQAGWDRGQEVEVKEAPRTSPPPLQPKSNSHGKGGSGFPAGSGRVLSPLPNPQATTVSVSDTSPTPGFRLVLCVVASGASLLLSRDTLACCTKVRLEAPRHFESFFNRSKACLSKTTKPGKVTGTPKSPSDLAPAKHFNSPNPSTPTSGGDSTSPVSHAVSADDMNWLPKGASYAGLIHKLSLLHAVMRMRALHGPVGLSATGLSNSGGITYSLRVCAHAAPTVGEKEAEGQWHAWEKLMMSTWIGPEIVWDADMRVMSSIASQVMGSSGDSDQGISAVTEGFGASRLWVSEWSEKNLVVTEGAMLQKEMSLVMVQRHKREISRMDKAKMALDEIQERLPRSMPLPVPPSGEAPDLFFYFLLREVTRMRVLMDAVWSSLVDIEQVLEGQRQLNPEQDDLVHSLYIDCVPTAWASVAYPSLRPLGAWFSDLVVRSDALGDWQRQGMLPPSVWMGGLFSPDGLLATAVTQHSMQMMWQISQVQVHFDVTRKTADEIALGCQRSGKDGLLVHGFFLEAAGWDVRLGALEELKPSQGPEEIPVISIRISKSEGQATECPFSVPLTQTPNAYNCPVYRTQARGETFLFSGLLKTRLGDSPWTRAGTAMILDAYMG